MLIQLDALKMEEQLSEPARSRVLQCSLQFLSINFDALAIFQSDLHRFERKGLWMRHATAQADRARFCQ